MTTAALTLTEFLVARIAEDEVRDVASSRADFLDGIPGEHHAEAVLAHDRLLQVQGLRLQHRVHALGWAFLGSLWEPALRRRAAVYSDHPDYREEWRP